MPSRLRDERLLSFARELRKNMTPEERKLWYLYLKAHPRFRFRRQEIIGSYIADFYCAQAKLVIEIDGSQHFSEDVMAYDAARTSFFAQQNLRVIRFNNADINQRFTNVCETIEHHLADTFSACAAGGTRDSQGLKALERGAGALPLPVPLKIRSESSPCLPRLTISSSRLTLSRK